LGEEMYIAIPANYSNPDQNARSACLDLSRIA
jgi:hypothetical protein